MGVGRFVFTPLLPVMLEEGQLTVGDGGALASVHFLGYAMGAIVGVYFRWHARSQLALALVLVGLSTLAMGVTDNVLVWYAARWLAGLCSAIALIVVSTYFLRRLAEVNRAELQGVIFAGVGAGTALVGLAMLAFMAGGVSSKVCWTIFGLATLAAAVPLLLMLRPELFPVLSSTVSVQRGDDLRAWPVILPYGVMGAGYIIPATYLPLIAQQTVSSPLVYGWGWPVFGIAATLSTLVSARLHATYSNRSIWIVSQLLMAFGLLLPVISPNMIAIIASALCVGGTFMVVTMAGIKEAHRMSGDGGTQRLVAIMTAGFAIGQIVGPILAASAYDLTGSFSYPLALAGILLALSLLPMAIGEAGIVHRN